MQPNDMVLVSREVLREIEHDLQSLDDSLRDPIPGVTTTEGNADFVLRIAEQVYDLYETAPRIKPKDGTRTLTLSAEDMQHLGDWLDDMRSQYDNPDQHYNADTDADGGYDNYRELTRLWEAVLCAL